MRKCYRLNSNISFLFCAKNLIILLFFLYSHDGITEKYCHSGTRTLLVNGDDSNHNRKPKLLDKASDYCSFYLDLNNMREVFSDKSCEKVLVPKHPPSLQGFCFGIGKKYRDNFPTSTSNNFIADMKDTIISAKEKSVIYLTDHGTIKDGIHGQNEASLAEKNLSITDLREGLSNTIKEKKESLCNCSDCPCDLPPTVFTFDFCFSGGLLNGLLDEKDDPIENVCGISASSAEEFAWADETLSSSLKNLKKGLGGIFKKKYKKWDLDGDGSISLKEWANFSFIKHNKSVPNLTSDRYINKLYSKLGLDKKKINLKLDAPTCDKATTRSTDQELDYNLQKIKYEAEKKQLLKTASIIYRRKITDITPNRIELLKKEEKEADDVMRAYGDFSYKLDNISASLLQQDIIFEIRMKEQKDKLNQYNTLMFLKRLCEEFKNCPEFDSNYLDINDPQTSLVFKHLDEKCGSNSPEGSNCFFFKEQKNKLTQNQIDIQETKSELIQNREKSYNIIFNNPIEKLELLEKTSERQKNNEVTRKIRSIKKYFFKIKKKTEKDIEKSKSPEIAYKSLKEAKKKLMEFISDSNYKNTEVLGHTIPNPIESMMHKAHRKKIKTRKAMTIVKELAVKKELIEKGLSQELRKLETLEKCENTPMFKYKK